MKETIKYDRLIFAVGKSGELKSFISNLFK
jgi:hypothetical protein